MTAAPQLQMLPTNCLRRTLHPWSHLLGPDDEGVRELARSLNESGRMDNPITVRSGPGTDATYQVVAGERRLVAAQVAGWERVPVEVVELSDLEAVQVSIDENLRRRSGGLPKMIRCWLAVRLRDLLERTGRKDSYAVIAGRLGYASRTSALTLIRVGEAGSVEAVEREAERCRVPPNRLFDLPSSTLKEMAELPPSRFRAAFSRVVESHLGRPHGGASAAWKEFKEELGGKESLRRRVRGARLSEMFQSYGYAPQRVRWPFHRSESERCVQNLIESWWERVIRGLRRWFVTVRGLWGGFF